MVQGAVKGAGQAGQGAEAAAGQAGRWAGQADLDGTWKYRVSNCVVEGLRAQGEAWRTFFYTGLLKEVESTVALCNTKKQT